MRKRLRVTRRRSGILTRLVLLVLLAVGLPTAVSVTTRHFDEREDAAIGREVASELADTLG